MSIDQETTGGAMWGWIAGIAVLILVVFVLIGGWTGPSNTKTTYTGYTCERGYPWFTGRYDNHDEPIYLCLDFPRAKKVETVK